MRVTETSGNPISFQDLPPRRASQEYRQNPLSAFARLQHLYHRHHRLQLAREERGGSDGRPYRICEEGDQRCLSWQIRDIERGQDDLTLSVVEDDKPSPWP